jgi:TetR/AcrR family transcriptional repressor of nem operon
MRKGEETRERVLRQVAGLFNRQGYFGSSYADIMRITGLGKGGVYNHFANKDELALEAFDYAVGLIGQRIKDAVTAKQHAADRLLALIQVFCGLANDSPIPGGCPVMNTAIECDDAHPALRERARRAMDGLRRTIRSIITKGMERRQIRKSIDPDLTATLLISTLEGALMMSKLYGNDVHMRRAAAYLGRYIDAEVRDSN